MTVSPYLLDRNESLLSAELLVFEKPDELGTQRGQHPKGAHICTDKTRTKQIGAYKYCNSIFPVITVHVFELNIKMRN